MIRLLEDFQKKDSRKLFGIDLSGHGTINFSKIEARGLEEFLIRATDIRNIALDRPAPNRNFNFGINTSDLISVGGTVRPSAIRTHVPPYDDEISDNFRDMVREYSEARRVIDLTKMFEGCSLFTEESLSRQIENIPTGLFSWDDDK